ncbi:MAG: double zinc ribbon domain-containing protein, partial [Candidatus Hodarchaeales archaeon]
MQRVKCPRCGDLVPKTAYCVYCGENLKNTKPIQPNTAILCPHCEKKVPSLEFCIHCGNKISNLNNMVQEKPIGTTICPLCRKETPENHNFCHYCGGKLKEGDLAEISQPICNRCWKPNPPNTGYCIHCGFKQHTIQSTLLDKSFEGFEFDISDLLQKTPFSLAVMKSNLSSSKNFPVKSTIVHSRYFGVSKSEQASKFRRNFGSFDLFNIRNYLGTIFLILFIYS